uniref:TRAP-type C4-dicarboxylate transport system,large permease component n=1 Tax=uncultured beta proteobacterium TaxID=86027 RepID=Q2Z0B2_9PROT|nr:TRAP-type C4-dicarboxylate transport system,large permease component [uncultured beta proteobacterium]
MPLFIVLGAAALTASRDAQLDPALLIVEFARLAASPNLVAIPLFVLAGATLGQGGAPQRLVRFFNALLGWMPSGIAWVAVATCMVFTAFSGASGVTILALGGLLYPMLKNEHYPEKFALGLITSGGSMGLLLPPSLAVLLYGVVAQVNIGELFVAGLLPTLILFAMVGAYALLRGARGAHRHRFQWHELAAAARAGWADLLLPVGVIGGLAAGWLTVAELAACTALYALVLETLVHRTISVNALVWVAYEAATLVGSLFIILGAEPGADQSADRRAGPDAPARVGTGAGHQSAGIPDVDESRPAGGGMHDGHFFRHRDRHALAVAAGPAFRHPPGASGHRHSRQSGNRIPHAAGGDQSLSRQPALQAAGARRVPGHPAFSGHPAGLAAAADLYPGTEPVAFRWRLGPDGFRASVRRGVRQCRDAYSNTIVPDCARFRAGRHRVRGRQSAASAVRSGGCRAVHRGRAATDPGVRFQNRRSVRKSP